MRRPLESAQYTSDDYTQTLDDHELARSLGSTGDCYDNALAESFVDSFKTELIADRVWRTHEQAELAIVEWVGWFNDVRLHSSLGDIPPVEFEQRHAAANAPNPSISVNGSVAALSPKPAAGLTTSRILAAGLLADRNRADRQLPALTARPREMAAANGSAATAIALPPMEMTSYGQPANGSRDFDLPRGLPTGLGQPPDGSRHSGPPRGLPTFPQAPTTGRIRLKDSNNDTSTTKEPT